jgi:hypothetical protein
VVHIRSGIVVTSHVIEEGAFLLTLFEVEAIEGLTKLKESNHLCP